MQLNQLEYLLALSREGSYQKAAKRLNVSQSTISMAVKNLEDELDYLLVQRSNKGISFTEKGKMVLEKAAEIDVELQELLNLKNTFVDGMAGKFHIAGASHGYNLQMVDLIIQLQEQYPRLQICLEDRNNMEILREVAQNRYLMGLLQLNSINEIFYRNEIEKYNLEFAEIDSGKMCFAVGPEHRYYGKVNVELREFLNYSTIVSRYQIDELFLNYFRNRGYKEQIVILNDLYISRQLIEKSPFYTTFFPEFAIYRNNGIYEQNLKEVSFCDFNCTYKTGWVYRKNDSMLRNQRVIQLIQQTWKTMQEVEVYL